MAELTERPFPPGRYPLVVVGSGPGALQLTYCLQRLGVEHAVISEDPAPGGMFRRWPVFQRMLSWTKPYAGCESLRTAYERYDWNSLLADEDQHRGIMPGLMDGTSYFPSRPEMERGLVTFASATELQVRYGCRWETTAQTPGKEFVLGTSDGEYRAPVVVFAVGVAEPWKPSIPGLEPVPSTVSCARWKRMPTGGFSSSASRTRASRSPAPASLGAPDRARLAEPDQAVGQHPVAGRRARPLRAAV